jgi:ribosomal 50S subunit-recycling heat shock protein
MIIELLIISKITKSRAEAKRLVCQGQVKVNGLVYESDKLFEPIQITEPLIIYSRNQEVTFEKI